MTAEERAAGLCFEGPGLEGTCEHETTGVACHDCILAAIRAAEREAADEALERAAAICDGRSDGWTDAEMRHRDALLLRVAASIRSLKSTGGGR